MNTIDLEVQGMSCGSCVKRVTQALQPIPGVADVAVDLESGHVRVSGSIDSGAQRLIAALAGAGYPAKLSSGPTAHPKASGGGCCGG